MLGLYKRKNSLGNINPPIFAIHGGGKIGLGLMADILSRDKANFQVIATSDNTFLKYLINNTSSYYLQHGPLADKKVTKVDSKSINLKMVSRDSETIIKLYQEANMVAICLTADVLSMVAIDIAHGLISRYRENKRELNILIMMNKPQSDQFVRNTIIHEMIKRCNLSSLEANKIISKVKFIPCVVDRIVTDIKIDNIKDQLRTQLKQVSLQKDYWFIDSAKPFAQQIENILLDPKKLAAAITNFNLQYSIFNAEEEFNLFVPDSCLEAKTLSSVKLVKNIDLLEAVKNKYINGPHAILAWSGALLGCNTIAEAIKYPGSAQFINEMMEKEICPILIAEYPDITKQELDFLKKSFFSRCERSVDDLVTRVGRDPLRKLDSGERIRGTIELKRKHGLTVPTSRLEYGIAAGILYAVKGNDPANPGCQKIVNLYNNSNHNYKTVLCYNGPYNNGTYLGLDPDRDKLLVNNILYKISKLDAFCENAKLFAQIGSSKGYMLSNTILNSPIGIIPRPFMSINEKKWIHSYLIGQYSLTKLIYDPVPLFVTSTNLKKGKLFYVSNEFAKKSFSIFGSIKGSNEDYENTNKKRLQYYPKQAC